MTGFFSPDYFTARQRFRSGVLAAGGQIESILLGAIGPGGEDLTIDIGWFGSPAPRRAFIHTSGLHGVEGFAGSAIQLQWLEEGLPELAPDSAIALVHVLNPFGMAWLRRANENNVDLNRNFLAAGEEFAGAPDHYAALDSFLNPASPPPGLDFFTLRCASKVLRYGITALRRSIDGQYDFPRGLFFGGQRQEQGPRRFQLYISGRFGASERLVAIDVHTGPGGFGEDYLLVSDTAEGMIEMQRAYGGGVLPHDPPQGSLEGLWSRMFPAAQVHSVVQEFGTRHAVAVLAALRAENRLHQYGASKNVNERAKKTLLEAFCPANEAWHDQVLTSGREAIAKGLSLAFDDQSPPTV